MTKIFNFLLKSRFFLFFCKYLHYHSYCLKRYVNRIVKEYDVEGKKLIDIGAGGCQYQAKFKKLMYQSQDVINNNNQSINYVCDAKNIPVEDGSFDYILCTQVLEHLKEPALCFKEFNRILKKDGLLFLTTHQSYQEHMLPDDYFRYTKYGLRYLAEKNNFQVISIKPEGGRFILIAKQLTIAIPRVLKNRYLVLIYWLIFFFPLLLINVIFYYLDYLDKEKLITINYECIFKKNH